MKVDEYSIGVFAFLILLGNGTEYPCKLTMEGSKVKFNDEYIESILKLGLPKCVRERAN